MTKDEFVKEMDRVLGPVEQDECKQMAMQFGTTLAKAFDAMKDSTTVAADEYKCSSCGGIFKKGWTDEEAHAEHVERFGRDPAMEVDGGTDVLICENCNSLGEAHFGKTEGMTKQ